MTISAYIIFGLLVAGLAFIIWLVWYGNRNAVATIVLAIVATIVAFGIFFGMHWYYSSTAAGSRAMKDQKSDLAGGLERTIKVYNIEGKEIWSYTGKMDLTYDEDGSIYYDDGKTGKRTIIYNPTGITIVEEK